MSQETLIEFMKAKYQSYQNGLSKEKLEEWKQWTIEPFDHDRPSDPAFDIVYRFWKYYQETRDNERDARKFMILKKASIIQKEIKNHKYFVV